MKDGINTFDVLASIERHIGALKPLQRRQNLICIGEYPIKLILNDLGMSSEVTSPILIEKSSDEIYKWLPIDYNAGLVLGFEEAHIDTHFWYNVMPIIMKNNSVIESVKKKPAEKLQNVIFFSSVWDGIGSAALPTLISKFKAANMDSLSIAVFPSSIQPVDAHFNSYAALKICLATEGATLLLMGRDQIENYEGVDRRGELIKGNLVANYLLNLFLTKDSLVEEISELSRTFSTKLFTPIVVTGASYMVYGSIENMLNTALLKPFLPFDLSTATLLYVVLRMPSTLKDIFPRGKIELEITNWFKEKTSLQSIHISEPIYTEDVSDRIDAVLFVGGFDIAKMLSELESKVSPLKKQATEKGFMTEDGSFIIKVEEEMAPPISETEPMTQVVSKPQEEMPLNVGETQSPVDIASRSVELTSSKLQATGEPPINDEVFKVVETAIIENQQPSIANESMPQKQSIENSPAELLQKEESQSSEKQKRSRRNRKVDAPPAEDEKLRIKSTKSRQTRKKRKTETKES